MRFNRSVFTTSNVFKTTKFRKILMQNLGLTSTDADTFLNMKKQSFKSYHQIIKNCQMCQKYNIEIDSLKELYYCLKYSQNYRLEHKINIFKDIGVPIINTSLLRKAYYHLNTKVSKFKEQVNIPPMQNIAMNIFNDEVPKDISNKLNDELTLQQYYWICLLYCKTSVFNLPYLNDKILLSSYIKIKSISMIVETLKVLRTDLHYNEEMIKNHPSVIVASADNIRSLLSNFTDILGMPIITFLRKYPQILLLDANNIKQLITSFKQYRIPDENVKRCLNIFWLSNDTFHERLKIMKRHEELNIWYKHPRMLQILLSMNKIKYRIKYADNMKLTKRPQIFLSKILNKNSIDKVAYKHYLKYVLIQELGIDKELLTEHLNTLSKHKYWKMVTFIDIVKMLKYLKKHFTINEICSNIHIIFHERSKVEKILADVKQQYSQNTKYSFTNSQYLALCLYILEKDCFVPGNDTSSNKQKAKQQSLEEQNIVEKSDNNTSITKEVGS